ncbi:hypothetical protein BGX28_000466 [Mortierella sp. GBA30]|nr:hypothetical protein BGX28_000466 [Mortierella sp. GBA30]
MLPAAPPSSSSSSSSSASLSFSSSSPSVQEQRDLQIDTLTPTSLLSHPAIILVGGKLVESENATQFHTVNVFDFDQTLFRSPLPNPTLWDPAFVGTLITWNNCGPGWWHTPETLEFGPEAEASAWDGWWNEDLVQDVIRSSNDPGCLTILLTGRNGPVYGDRLIRMIRAKRLDFDLVATKPSTVARLDPTQSKTKILKEIYLKLHTFSAKHDFLYNVLFEYPSIQHMHIWDDRPGQVAKFRQAGQEWLDKKMLQTFEITVVHLPHRYMDTKREIDLVSAMVETHNQQVELEAKGGAFLVAGQGLMPKIRPELEGTRLWDPYETYVPQRRSRIELVPIIQHTGILFSERVQSFLRNNTGSDALIKPPQALQRHDLPSWVAADEMHVFLCKGMAPAEYLRSIGGLGATVLLEIDAVGEFEGRIWALRVKDVGALDPSEEVQIVAPRGDIHPTFESFINAYSHVPAAIHKGSYMHNVDSARFGHAATLRGGAPHIMIAYDRSKGTRPAESSRIIKWKSLKGRVFSRRIIIVGRIGQKRLLGMKSRNFGQHAVVPRAEVSIANLVKQWASKRDMLLIGREMGATIRAVQEEMERQSILNRTANTHLIQTIVEVIVDHTFESKRTLETQTAAT